jgi:hypothetical protein
VFDRESYLVATPLAVAGKGDEKLILQGAEAYSFAASPRRGGWTLLLGRYFPSDTVPVFDFALQRFGNSFEPQVDAMVLDAPGVGGGELKAALGLHSTPEGLVWLAVSQDVFDPPSSGLFLSFVDRQGTTLREAVSVSERTADDQTPPKRGLLVSPKAGVIVVVFSEAQKDSLGNRGQTDTYLRRFSLTGLPLGPSSKVNSFSAGFQGYAAVAGLPTGEFVVVWQSEGQDGSFNGIYAQRFDARGRRAGREFRVNQTTLSDQQLPMVEMDDRGNFLVVWESFEPRTFDRWDVMARLYRSNGEPVGPEIVVNQARGNDQQNARVAYAHNGTFVVGWEGYEQFQHISDEETEEDVFVRRISASPGDEPCVVSRGLLRCDTGRTGGELEVTHPFGRSVEGPVMLGDIDGDGRADPCEWWNGRFRCDTDHEGGAAEVRIGLQGSGVPLLGDVDGDGRADPCLYTTGRFACDTVHNGKTAEKTILFGKAGEAPLLGDVDGDGRDDACGWAAGVIRCETKNNGGAPEVVLSFGQPGDQPLLGDFDGDGDDDPCVYRSGQLLCDTTHNGGAAEGVLTFGQPGDRVVLGNLDGL